MEAISICWVPGYRGRHLPVHIPRCRPSRHSEFAVRKTGPLKHCPSFHQTTKGYKFPIKYPIFLHGQPPFCPFLPRDRQGRSFRTRGKRKPTPFALGNDQEDGGILQDSSEGDWGSSGSPSHDQIAPLSWSGPKNLNSKERLSLLTSKMNVGDECERKVILSRLRAVGSTSAAEKEVEEDKSHWVDIISENDVYGDRLRAADSVDFLLSNPLAVEEEKRFVQSRRWPLRENSNHGQNSNQGKKETRRNVLKHYWLPPILDRLAFQQFPLSFFSGATKQKRSRMHSSMRGGQVNLRVSYEVSYMVEGGYGSDATTEHGMELLDHHRGGILDLHSKSHSKKAGALPSPIDCWTSPKGMTVGQMGRIVRRGGHLMGFGRSARGSGKFRCPNSDHCGGVGLRNGGGGMLGVRQQQHVDGSGRRLWSRADAQVEAAGNLLKDWLAIVGLVAFVISGTYAFAMSYRHLKTGLWLRKGLAVMAARSAHGWPPSVASTVPTSGEEITDDTFVDTIQKRPTFVLFYAPWCPFCQQLDPAWKELGNLLIKKGYDVQLAKMNADENPKIAENFKIKKYPTFIFFKDGMTAVNGTYHGPRNVKSFMKFIHKRLEKPEAN